MSKKTRSNWRQELVNAQVDVNRAVFEMNREGFPKGHASRKKMDEVYLKACVNGAIVSLQECLKNMK